jgi:hypothetical protein
MLSILYESEANHFDGIATGNESWFQYLYSSSKMFARVNLLRARGQLNLEQWFKDRVKIAEAPSFQNATPAAFAGQKPA